MRRQSWERKARTADVWSLLGYSGGGLALKRELGRGGAIRLTSFLCQAGPPTQSQQGHL
jgi:hypothetical protein